MNFHAKSGEIFTNVGGTDVRHFLFKNGRWYVTWKSDSLLSVKYGRTRMFRSHFVFMELNGMSKIKSGFEIHHIDHNKQNDNPTNLEMLSKKDHIAKHAGTHVRSEEWRAKQSVAGKNRYLAGGLPTFGVGRAAGFMHKSETREKMANASVGSFNSQYREDIDDAEVVAFFSECKNFSKTARHFGCSISAVRSRVEKRENDVDWKLISNADLIEMFESEGKSVNRLSKKINAPISSLWRKLKVINNDL